MTAFDGVRVRLRIADIESGKPVHVVTPETDLAAELKRGVAFLRAKKTVPK